MLDDLKLIAQRDHDDALGIAEKQPKQLLAEFTVQLPEGKTYTNVVVSGMGGSALAPDIAKSWPGAKVPFEVVRDYTIPKYVDASTLFIASSFSGNTEETLSSLSEAEKTEATIVVIAAGGKLEERAAAAGHVFVKLDHTIPQPRLAALNSYKAFITIMEAAGVIEAGSKAELEALVPKLEQAVQSWRPDSGTSENLAKQLAQELMGKSVVMYSSGKFAPIAYKWKISFQENAKNVAWYNYYPEFNHNEFIGWTSHPVEKPYGLLNITSSFDHPQIQKRFAISTRLLSGKRPEPITIEAQGESVLEQLLWTSLLGDFTSIYLALLNNVNPTPVELVEKFKAELANS